MPPPVALCLFTAFILWLFFRDARRRIGISAALWIPLTWLFVIGSRPVSMWFGGGGSALGPEGYEDTLLDKGLFFFLIVAGLCVVINRRTAFLNSVLRNKWLFLYFLYLALSVLWTDDSFVSLKRWVKDFGNVVMVLVVVTEQDPREAVRALLARFAFLMIPLSVLVIKYYPGISRAYDMWTNTPAFQGITLGKNLLGMTLFVCGLSLFWMALELWDGKRTNQKGVWPQYAILLLMTVWLLSIANSATAVTCTILGGSILVALRAPAIRGTVRWLGTFSVGIVIIVAFLQVSGLGAMLMKEYTEAVGRDSTMHGRDAIWQSVLAEEDVNPLIGVGFYSFWSPERNRRLSKGYYYSLGEAHNGYIETYLNNGLIGLGLLLIVLASAVTRIKRDVLEGSPFGGLRLAFMVTILLYNISESIFDRLGGGLWFFLILMMMFESRAVTESAVSQVPRRMPDSAPRADAWRLTSSKRWESPARGVATRR